MGSLLCVPRIGLKRLGGSLGIELLGGKVGKAYVAPRLTRRLGRESRVRLSGGLGRIDAYWVERVLGGVDQEGVIGLQVGAALVV